MKFGPFKTKYLSVIRNCSYNESSLVKIYLEFRRNPAGIPARTWPDLSGIPGGFRVDSG